jgi:hypothetical protein
MDGQALDLRAVIRRPRCASSSASMSTAVEAKRYSPIIPMISAALTAGGLPSEPRGIGGQAIVSLVAASMQSLGNPPKIA